VTPGDEVGPATASPSVAAPENKAHGLSSVLCFIYLIHMSNDIVGVMLIHLCYSLIHVYTVTLCSKQDSSLTAINLNK
jgi:hypothetical protein